GIVVAVETRDADTVAHVVLDAQTPGGQLVVGSSGVAEVFVVTVVHGHFVSIPGVTDLGVPALAVIGAGGFVLKALANVSQGTGQADIVGHADAGGVLALNLVGGQQRAGTTGAVVVELHTRSALDLQASDGAVVEGGQLGVATLRDAGAALEAGEDRAVVAHAVITVLVDGAAHVVGGEGRGTN